MADLSFDSHGLHFPNPFLIASGPPGTNYAVIAKAFREGWGGVVAKTVSLDASKVVNVSPRYAKLHAASGEVVGWENIELISDRPLSVWLEEFRKIKAQFPDRVLIASVMEEFRREAWEEIVSRCEQAGVDGFELNFSCPHGLPERKMGSAMGQDPAILEEVCSWVKATTSKPVWAKMTPNITSIEEVSAAALRGGCTGISAINTLRSIMGVDLATLRPLPTVEGYSTPGGYSSVAVRPVALRMVAEIAQLVRSEFPGRSLSGIGGVESASHAAEFLLLGADTVQVCTGVMKFGYGLIHDLCSGLLEFMERHGFKTLADFRGASLPYLTTHADLVARQAARKATARTAVQADGDWRPESFVEQSGQLADA